MAIAFADLGIASGIHKPIGGTLFQRTSRSDSCDSCSSCYCWLRSRPHQVIRSNSDTIAASECPCIHILLTLSSGGPSTPIAVPSLIPTSFTAYNKVLCVWIASIFSTPHVRLMSRPERPANSDGANKGFLRPIGHTDQHHRSELFAHCCHFLQLPGCGAQGNISIHSHCTSRLPHLLS
jgi:hypothetical protein